MEVFKQKAVQVKTSSGQRKSSLNHGHLFHAFSITLMEVLYVCVPAQICDGNGTGLYSVMLQFLGSQIVSSHWQVPQAGNRPPTPP